MAKDRDAVLDGLRQASKGLRYTSETDAPFSVFAWPGGDKLTQARLLQLAGAESGTAVEEDSLDNFFAAVPPEDATRFRALRQTLEGQLSGIKVYKVGDEAEKDAYVVGRTQDGRWAGLKTTVVET
jgi:hypothetical protein